MFQMSGREILHLTSYKTHLPVYSTNINVNIVANDSLKSVIFSATFSLYNIFHITGTYILQHTVMVS